MKSQIDNQLQLQLRVLLLNQLRDGLQLNIRGSFIDSSL
jgi:hypothetical protein